MSVINVKVIDQNLTITNAPLIASGGVNEDYVVFDFDSTWDGFGKVAVFYKDGDEANLYDSILDQNNKAIIPFEVLDEEGKFWFGVVGTKNDITLTSEVLWYDIAKGTYEKESRGATPDIYVQMIQLAEAIIEHLNNTPYVYAVEDEEFELPIHTINDNETSEQSTWSSSKILEIIQQAILDSNPVGSIISNISGDNPSTYIGGTWVAWGSGRVPVGVDTTQTEFDTVEETGGEKTHTLTANEIPAHTHTVTDQYPIVGTAVGVSSGSTYISRNDIESTSRTSSSIGGGQAHNNLQPYITCYMWKRTE